MMNDGLASDDQVKTCIKVRFRANILYLYPTQTFINFGLCGKNNR